MVQRKKWTKEEISQLKELTKYGYTTFRIARIMGRTRNAIRVKKNRIAFFENINKQSLNKDCSPVTEISNLKRIITLLNNAIETVPNAKLEIKDNQVKAYITEYREI